MKSKAEIDRANLDAVLALVRQHCPGAKSIDLQTSDQGLYGFALRTVTYWDDTESEGGDVLPPAVQDEIDDLLSDLGWDGVVGESPQGDAVVEIPAETESRT